MRSRTHVPFLLLIVCMIVIQSCSKEVPEFFSIEDEKLLADELRTWASEDESLIILSETEYTAAYAYANGVFEGLIRLDAPDSVSAVINRDVFEWQLYLISSTELNGFVTPAGHLYVTTGIIKLLETPDAFAALLGHLVAHADQRHVTKQLLNAFTSKELLEASKGSNSVLLGEVAENVFGRRVAFTFSSGDEQQAEMKK